MARRRRRRYYQPAPAVPSEGRETVAERLAEWRTRCSMAKKLRDDWETKYHVRELEELYLGTQGYDQYGEDQTWYNHFFATVRTQLPSLFFQAPSFRVRPRASSGTNPNKRVAAILETLLQSIAAEENNLETEGKLALLQSFFRLGCLKTCYDPRAIPNPQAGEPLTTAFMGTQVPLLDDRGEPLTEPETVLTDEVYSWEWVDARKLLLPNEGPSQRKWTWIGEEIEVLLEDAKEDPRFPKNLREMMVANGTQVTDSAVPQTVTYTPGDEDSPEEALFRYTECWCIEEKRLYVWAEGQPWSDTDFLLDEPYSPGVEDHPYAILSFLPIVGPTPSPWPLPMTYNWLPLQREYNAARRQVTSAGARAARKILFDKTTFPDSEEARKALNSSVDMEGVEVNDLGRPPIVFGSDTLSQDVTRSTAALQYDWRVITGATGSRLSGVRDSNTATEASITEKAATLRDSEGQGLVAAWLGIAGTKMLQMVRQTLTLGRWVTMRGYNDKEFQETLGSEPFQQALAAQYGPELAQVIPRILPMMPGLQESFRKRLGEEAPLKVTRQMMQFEMDVDVHPASLGVRTLEAERQSWLQFLTTIGQFPQLLQSRALLTETANRFQFIGDDLVDELLLLGQKMAQQAAQIAQAKAGGLPQQGPVPNGQLPPQSQQAL